MPRLLWESVDCHARQSMLLRLPPGLSPASQPDSGCGCSSNLGVSRIWGSFKGSYRAPLKGLGVDLELIPISWGSFFGSYSATRQV